MWRNALRSAVLVACMGGASIGAAQQISSATLTPSEMRATAFVALRDQQSARALALAEALLLRDPNDRVALRIGARAALNIGQSDVALERARTLFHLSENDEERYFAARLAAFATAQDERYTASQYWLRRARQLAPNDTEAEAVAADYRAVQSRNPLSFTVDFGIAPSSNINDGTFEENFDIELFGTEFTLPFSAEQRELSGYEISVAGQMSYVLAQTPQGLTQARASLSTRQYRLSRESRDVAPGFDLDALNSWRIAGGLQHFWSGASSNSLTSASFDYGLTHRQGELYATDAVLGLARQWRLDDRSVLVGSLSVGRVDYRVNEERADIWSTGLSWSTRLGNDDTVTLFASLGQSVSDTPRLDNSVQSVGMAYDFGTVADQFEIDITADYQWRTFGSGSNAVVDRFEQTAEVALAIGLPRLEIYGFTPVVSVEGARTLSTVSRFQTESLTLDMNFRSSF